MSFIDTFCNAWYDMSSDGEIKRGGSTMKATGIVRNIDSLGRIVLPIELRRTLGIDASKGDPIEIYMDGTSIVLRKHEPNCVFCGSSKKVTEFKGKNVCEQCRKELTEKQ